MAQCHLDENEMKKIKFFSSYCSDEQIYNNIISSWAKNKNTYKDLFITKDNDYEYAICFNLGLPDRELDKNRVIGFSHEPKMTCRIDQQRENQISNRVSRYYISNSFGMNEIFTSGYSFILPAEYGKSESETYSHENKMSMILSLSNFMTGHKMRHDLLNEILKTDMDIHFYAEGLNKIYSDPRVKEFNWGLFHIPYEKYQTQIVIENIIDEMWSSEKLSNCIIKETLPIYYGSKLVSDLFYGKDEIQILGNDINENLEIIKENYYSVSDKSDLLKKAKKKLYSEMNLMEFIYQAFK